MFRADIETDGNARKIETAKEWAGDWEPSNTLPDWAVRIRVVVESVECKEAGEITKNEAFETGLDWESCPRRAGFTNGKPNGVEVVEWVKGWLQGWLHPSTDFAWFTMLRMEEV